MTDLITVRPANPGETVRHPDTKLPIAQDGEKVRISTYWQRRLNDGSVVVVTPPAPKAEKKNQTKPVDNLGAGSKGEV